MLESRDMKVLDKLKDMFIDEGEAITKKGTLTPADGEAGKTIFEALYYYNCLCCEVEEGASMMIDPYGNHVPYEGYAERRGRNSMGRYTSRRSYGNYARHGETIDNMIDGLKDMKRELGNQ